LDEAAAVARVSALGCAAERASCAQAWVSPQVFFALAASATIKRWQAADKAAIAAHGLPEATIAG